MADLVLGHELDGFLLSHFQCGEENAIMFGHDFANHRLL